MNIVVKSPFRKDYPHKSKINPLRINSKISQIETVKNISQITGMIPLEGYSHHYRIKTYKYGFDDQRNWVRRITFIDNKATELTIRKISYR